MDTTDTRMLLPTSLGDDDRAVLDHLTTGRPLDEEAYRRVRERAERITEEIRREHGELNIAVDLIREGRNEE
jgi:hypothetical protein